MDALNPAAGITLAVPNFNGARYLRHTMESLAAQEGLVRWWFQDGASTDESVCIAREYAGPQDKIVSESDKGQTDALNRALPAMGGEIMGWLNSDDCLMPGAARAVLETFDAHPEADIVVGEVDWIDAEGVVTGHHAGTIQSLPEMLDIYRFWWREKQWVQPEVFWRRRLWEKAGPLNTRYDLAFDYAFWVRCMEVGAKVVRIPNTLVQFRMHAAQKSSRAAEAANEIRDICGEALTRDPSISKTLKKSLIRELAYDRYQSGQDYAGSRPSLAAMLVKNPDWLLLPEVQRRLSGAIGKGDR